MVLLDFSILNRVVVITTHEHSVRGFVKLERPNPRETILDIGRLSCEVTSTRQKRNSLGGFKPTIPLTKMLTILGLLYLLLLAGETGACITELITRDPRWF